MADHRYGQVDDCIRCLDCEERDAALAALRAVEELCAEADAAHEKYLAGVILDRFIVPANVTTERIRTAIRDALDPA